MPEAMDEVAGVVIDANAGIDHIWNLDTLEIIDVETGFFADAAARVLSRRKVRIGGNRAFKKLLRKGHPRNRTWLGKHKRYYLPPYGLTVTLSTKAFALTSAAVSRFPLTSTFWNTTSVTACASSKPFNSIRNGLATARMSLNVTS